MPVVSFNLFIFARDLKGQVIKKEVDIKSQERGEKATDRNNSIYIYIIAEGHCFSSSSSSST